MRPEDTPLLPDALKYLAGLRAKAIATAEHHADRLDRPDLLPRGPLPVESLIAEHECRATYLRMAIEALGGDAEASKSEAFHDVVRGASMPERIAA